MRTLFLSFVGGLVALVASGCRTSEHHADAEASIERALGLEGSVVFRTEGLPIDARPDAAGELSLREAVERAVESSPELQAALARVRAAQAEADLASTFPNPVLSLVFRFPEGGGGPDVEAGIAADLLAILQRPRRASAAGHRMQAESANALSTALDVVAEVRTQYAAAQGLEELAPILEARLAVLARLVEVARARVDAGEATRLEITALESERLALAVEVARKQEELRVARLALARRIGEPSSAAAWKLERWPGAAPVSTAESAWIETALRDRPEILAVLWELRARGDESALAGGGALEGASIGLAAEREDEWSAGPSASVPIPVFDTGSARKDRARAMEAESRHRLVEVQRAVVEEVRASLATFGGARANLDRVARELLPLQERRRAETEEAFRLGQSDVTALLVAEEALQETQSLRVELEREVATALVRLERAAAGRVQP